MAVPPLYSLGAGTVAAESAPPGSAHRLAEENFEKEDMLVAGRLTDSGENPFQLGCSGIVTGTSFRGPSGAHLGVVGGVGHGGHSLRLHLASVRKGDWCGKGKSRCWC